MTLDKRYRRARASGKGQMLSVMGEVKGSASYVAIERVTGVAGRKRTFALSMAADDRGTPSLSITVVPDSGTGASGAPGGWTSGSSRTGSISRPQYMTGAP
jgi:hypothetical protein